MVVISEFLAHQIKSGNAILFAGSGFSLGAQVDGKAILSSSDLRKELLVGAGIISDDGDSTIYDLSQSAQLFVSRAGKPAFLSYLEKRFSNCIPLDWHNDILSFPWYRIYTVNIDDVLETALKKTLNGRKYIVRNGLSTPTDIPIGPTDVAIVKLHGDANGQSDVVFTIEDYANVTAGGNYWLEKFSEDYMNKTFVFIGCSLLDTDLWHYIRRRSQQQCLSVEDSPIAYAITPEKRPGYEDLLRPLKVDHVKSTGFDFAASLVKQIGSNISLKEVLVENSPFMGKFVGLLRYESEAAFLFTRQYQPIRQILEDANLKKLSKSKFFLGYEPKWSDIANNRDSRRTCYKKIVESIKSGKHQIISGAAGEGKTTLLMRIAYNICKEYENVYWFKGESSPNTDFFFRLLKSMPKQKVILFVDRFSSDWASWQRLLETIEGEDEIAEFVIVASDRSPQLYDYSGLLAKYEFHKVNLGKLSDEEIVGIISALERDGMLGALQNKVQEHRVNAFKMRADKRLLVALREATSGAGFDNILRDEFNELKSDAARRAYLIAAIPHMNGTPVQSHVFSASLHHLNCRVEGEIKKNLEDTLITSDRGYVTTRHPLIAEIVVRYIASTQDNYIALESLIKAISEHAKVSRKGNEYRILRNVLQHENIIKILRDDKREAEKLYESVKSHCSWDAHYWLHYGSLEIKLKDLEAAEIHLRQSLEITTLEFAWHQMGMLYLLKSLQARDIPQAREYHERAKKFMLQCIDGKHGDPAYSYATYMSISSDILKRWGRKAEDVLNIDELKSFADAAWNQPHIRQNRRVSHAWKKLMAAIMKN